MADTQFYRSLYIIFLLSCFYLYFVKFYIEILPVDSATQQANSPDSKPQDKCKFNRKPETRKISSELNIHKQRCTNPTSLDHLHNVIVSPNYTNSTLLRIVITEKWNYVGSAQLQSRHKCRKLTLTFTYRRSRRQLLLYLLLCGTNLINPGPTCYKCSQPQKANQLMIKCTKCDRHSHKFCLDGNISYKEFHSLKVNPDWKCSVCNAVCKICNKTDRRKKTIQCDQCPNFYHTTCILKHYPLIDLKLRPWTCCNERDSTPLTPPIVYLVEKCVRDTSHVHQIHQSLYNVVVSVLVSQS